MTVAVSSSTCKWCRSSPVHGRQTYCSRRCRQAAFRLRTRCGVLFGPGEGPGLAFAYADPPYPGLSAKYYRREATYAGEVDHRALVGGLMTRYRANTLAGWALSTSAAALKPILKLCPDAARVCSWVKPGGVPKASYGKHNRWEPLIVFGGRALPGGVRDFLWAHPARGWGDLPGRKPLAFCAWMFELLGMLPGDTLDDMFPGSGMVSRAWDSICYGVGQQRRSAPAVSDASLLEQRQLHLEGAATSEGPADAGASLPRSAGLSEGALAESEDVAGGGELPAGLTSREALDAVAG